LHGLDDNSAIKFSGVKVGKVENIRLIQTDDRKGLKARVFVSLNIDKFSPKDSAEEAEQLLGDLVNEGLVAQLTVDSLITGAQYISLTVKGNADRSVNAEQPSLQMAKQIADKFAVFPTTAAQKSVLTISKKY